jgi:starch-binding outer membrane protein, SusD/RagB family
LFTPENEFANNEVLFQINFINSQIDNGENFSYRIDTLTAPAVTPFIAPRNSLQVINNYRDSWLYTDGRPRVTSPIYGTASPLISTLGQAINRDTRFRATMFSNVDTTFSRKRFWTFPYPAASINPATGTPSTGPWTTTANAGSVAVKKYFFISPIVFTNGNPQNFYLIRYSDVLLMLAEAQLELNPTNPDIYTNIQLVRNRAGVAMFTNAAWNALSTDNKRIAIRDERRWEFGFEHVRFFDLRRWGAAYSRQVLTATNTSIPPGTPDIAFVQWPYPQVELDNSPALKNQGGNPGW